MVFGWPSRAASRFASPKGIVGEYRPGSAGFHIWRCWRIPIVAWFTYGASSQTLSITIFSMTRRKVSPEVNALSAIIFVVVLAILLIINIVDIKKHEKEARR